MLTAGEYRKGDRVRVMVEGVLSYDPDDSGLSVEIEPGGGSVYMELKDFFPVIERLTPAHWPPVAADLWRHQGGLLFVEHLGDRPMFRDSSGNEWTVDRILKLDGPLFLVHREPAPGGASC